MNERDRFKAALELARLANEEAGGQPPCSNAPDLWFDVADHHPDGRDAVLTQADYSAAKKACLDCEIIVQCREYALRFEEPFGVWGGLSPFDRRKMRREYLRSINANPNRQGR